MPIIKLDVKDVGCTKPNCTRRLEPTARHHRRCETMFIRAFASSKTKKYKDFAQRYESYDPRDLIVLCAWHHCEIHLLYDDIILSDKYKICLSSLTGYSWTQAHALMSKLRKFCYQWESEETPGRNPIDCTPSKRYPAVRYTGPRKKSKRKKKKKT